MFIRLSFSKVLGDFFGETFWCNQRRDCDFSALTHLRVITRAWNSNHLKRRRPIISLSVL